MEDALGCLVEVTAFFLLAEPPSSVFLGGPVGSLIGRSGGPVTVLWRAYLVRCLPSNNNAAALLANVGDIVSTAAEGSSSCPSWAETRPWPLDDPVNLVSVMTLVPEVA